MNHILKYKKMKISLLIAILNISHSSCGNEPKQEPKTINNNIELSSIVDSALMIQEHLVIDSSSKKHQDTSRTTKAKNKDEDVLSGLFQDNVDSVINTAFANGNLVLIQKKIKEIEADAAIPSSYKNYWKTYLLYFSAIYTKNSLKDDDKASDAIDKAIESAEKNLKTSDDYALYAACISYSVQFSNMVKISNVSSKANENANRALELNPKNVRAYYVLTSQNFYTPKMFGGMTKVEEYGIKGINCPIKIDNNFYGATWSKENIYELLIKFYQTENRLEDLAKIKKLAKQEFPEFFKQL